MSSTVPDLARLLFATLRDRGWLVVLRDAVPLLPARLRGRFPALPDFVEPVLGQVVTCVNPTENAWLLGPADYASDAESGFCWNTFERMSLEAACDAQQRAAIAAFWDQHFPFMQAVHSDYDYLAVRLADDAFGCIVHGFAPEWEAGTVIAPDFANFVTAFAKPDPGFPLNLFV